MTRSFPELVEGDRSRGARILQIVKVVFRKLGAGVPMALVH